jgi:hypothetical protein
MGRAAQGIVRGVLEIPESAVSVAPLLKVHRQLGGDLRRLCPIACLFPGTDLQVPALLSAWRHPVRQGFTIQVMEEPIPRGYRPVRPCDEAACLDELPVVGEHGQPGFDVFRGLIDGRCDRRRGEGPPSHTRRFQQDLVFRTDLVQLLLDNVAQALRDCTPDGPHGLGDVPSRCLLVQKPLASHLFNDGHQKQWMAAGALMQHVRQRFGERWPPQPLTAIGSHFTFPGTTLAGGH